MMNTAAFSNLLFVLFQRRSVAFVATTTSRGSLCGRYAKQRRADNSVPRFIGRLFATTVEPGQTMLGSEGDSSSHRSARIDGDHINEDFIQRTADVSLDGSNERWLVCGDGDLSFCAVLSPDTDQRGIELTATVLEDEETHNSGE